MFVKADAFDVVPGRGLVAEEALIHLGLLHASGLHRNHFEVHHVMAGRCLMALDAVHGFRRRMAELGDRPLRRPVALGAVLAEELDVPILVGMAGRAIQDRFLRGEVPFRPVAHGLVTAYPVEEVFSHPYVLTVR